MTSIHAPILALACIAAASSASSNTAEVQAQQASSNQKNVEAIALDCSQNVGPTTSVDVNSDGSKVLVATFGVIAVLDGQSLEFQHRYRFVGKEASFGIDEGQIISSGAESNLSENRIVVHKDDTEREIHSIGALGYRVNVKQKHLAYGDHGLTKIVLVDLEAFKVKAEWEKKRSRKDPRGISVLDLSDSGIVSIQNGLDVYLWHPPYVQPPMKSPINKYVQSAQASPDGRFVAFGLASGTIDIWDAAMNAPLRTLQTDLANDVPIRCIDYSPDGRFLAALAQSGELLVWETSNYQEVGRVTAHDGLSVALSWFPDSRRVATGGHSDGLLIKIWRVASTTQ